MLLLEELVASELQGALEEVAGEGRANTGEERTSTLGLDDFPEATDHAIVVGGRVELDAGLDAAEMGRVVSRPGGHFGVVLAWDLGLCRAQSPSLDPARSGKGSPAGEIDIHINGGEGTVGDGAADGTGKGESGVETKAAQLRSRRDGGGGLLDDSVDLGGILSG